MPSKAKLSDETLAAMKVIVTSLVPSPMPSGNEIPATRLMVTVPFVTVSVTRKLPVPRSTSPIVMALPLSGFRTKNKSSLAMIGDCWGVTVGASLSDK